MEIEGWLSDLGLGRYVAVFAEHEIAAGDVAELTEDDLREMGLPIGPRRRILRAAGDIEALSGPTSGVVGTSDGSNELRDADRRAERRQMTVMFCDLVGSTALSGRLDPEDRGHGALSASRD